VTCADYAAFSASTERVMLGVGPLNYGFILAADGLAIITENELYAAQVRNRAQREAKRTPAEGMLRDLSEVKIGDPVVHEQHGIGRYLGLHTMDLGEGATEFLTLEYANNDKLYVPVSSLHLISRYSGAAPEAAPLHTLGSGQWDKAKKKAAAQVREDQLTGRRQARQGPRIVTLVRIQERTRLLHGREAATRQDRADRARHAEPSGKAVGNRYLIGSARPPGRLREHPTHPARTGGRNARQAAARSCPRRSASRAAPTSSASSRTRTSSSSVNSASPLLSDSWSRP